MAAFFSSLAFRLLPQLLLLAILPNPTTIFASKPLGFSIDLIHRDSSLSPLYDPSSTLTQRAEQAALRSMLRSRQIASWFANSTRMISSPVMPGLGEFLMKLSLGTPPRLNWAIMDTGSDLIWTMCHPCHPCFGKTQSMFYPLQSSTYKSQSCSTSSCTELPWYVCTSNQRCRFIYSYFDKSTVEGILASESLLFDDGAGTVKLPGIVFGCVHREGNHNTALLEAPGLVGLSRGHLSLINQIGSFIDKKFAYCLPPYNNVYNSMGQLKFGENAEFSGTEEVQETPMASDGGKGKFYVLTLTDITVGNNRLNIQFGGAQTKLGDARSIMIDSGTTLTHLAKDVYDQVANAVANVTIHERFYPPEQDCLCYHVEKHNGDPFEGLPEMTFHFADADWKLPPSNVFRMLENGIACLAIKDGQIPIFGNVAQQNMHVKYDLGKGLLSFAPTDCTQG